MGIEDKEIEGDARKQIEHPEAYFGPDEEGL